MDVVNKPSDKERQDKSVYLQLASLVYWFHVFWILVLLGTSLAAVYYTWLRPLSMAVLTTTMIAQIMWKGCPLVYLEGVFRKKHDPDYVPGGSFLGKFFRRTLKLDVPPWVIFVHLVLLFIVMLVLNLFLLP